MIIDERIQILYFILNRDSSNYETYRDSSRGQLAACLFTGDEQKVFLLIMSFAPQQRLTVRFISAWFELGDKTNADF